MPSNFRISHWLATNPKKVLVAFTLLLPVIPALIAYGTRVPKDTGENSADEPILQSWTYLQVAIFAYFLFLSRKGPATYLTAYTATMIPFAFFMQNLGKPIGLGLAKIFLGLGLDDPLAPATATFIHHVGVGALSWLLASIGVEITKELERPLSARRVDLGSGDGT